MSANKRIYQIPVDVEPVDAEPELVANYVEEFLELLNTDKLDVENNYFCTESMLIDV